MLKEFTFDLAEAPVEMGEQLDQTLEAMDTLLEKVDEGYDGFAGGLVGAEDPAEYDMAPAELEDKYWELRQQEAELRQRKARIEEFVEEEDQAGGWSHHRFTFREPSTDDGLYVAGRSSAMVEEARRAGKKVDPEPFGMRELMDRCLVEQPPEAPDNAIADMPVQVGEWLFDQLNDASSMGVESDLGNTSPQEALESYRQSRRTSTPSPDAR